VRNAKLLLHLLRLQLQGDPPGAPVCGIFLAAEPARPRATQNGFFVPAGPDPEKLELTLAKLAHLVGEARVGSPEPADTHRPDAFRMRRFVSGEHPACSRTRQEPQVARPYSARCLPYRPGRPELQRRDDRHGVAREQRTGFRVFRPAMAARVEMHAGQPALVFFRGLRGEVLAASGPWRSSGEWWEKDAWQQEEWDIEIQFAIGRETRRGLYRLTYDTFRRQWLVRGAYD
jgi:protein ImuB